MSTPPAELEITHDVPLAPLTTFGIGGPARQLITVRSADELATALTWLQQEDARWFVLGLGANILVGDRGFDGWVVKVEARGVEFGPGFVRAEAGVVIGELIEQCTERGLSGLEHYAGIPSTVGGALWQNLHFLAPDRESTLFIGEILEQATIFSAGEVKTVDAAWFNFGYDYSTLHDTDDVVLDATFRLEPSTSEAVAAQAEANLGWRARSHPEGAVKNSAGSIFRKIEGVGAGRLIDHAGLKGRRIGGAEVSVKHANYILNVGGATAKDVCDLIELIQREVEEHSGHHLTPEIGMVGDFA